MIRSCPVQHIIFVENKKLIKYLIKNMIFMGISEIIQKRTIFPVHSEFNLAIKQCFVCDMCYTLYCCLIFILSALHAA